ncbi:MAG: DUF484 family protein [Pseudomonadota bacterium]
MTKADDVERFLKSNPDFLSQRPELMAALDLGELHSDNLFEQRKIDVMRAREVVQQRRVEAMVENVESNQQLERMLHSLAVELLSAVSNHSSSAESDRQLDAEEKVRQQFGLHHVRILLRKDASSLEQGIEYPLLEKRVSHLSSVCDDRAPSRLLRSLFLDSGADIGSCAFVPLVASHKLIGVLAIGDQSPDRFKPGMGNIILDRLGELIGSYFGQ